MNTCISYLYRDASNYKTYNEIIIKGMISEEAIHPYLYNDEFFIPSVLGLQDLQELPFTTDDHVWHEIDSINPTTSQITTKLNAPQLINAFSDASRNEWHLHSVLSKKGLL